MEVVVITGSVLTRMVAFELVAVAGDPALSVTETVKVAVPTGPLGVPLMMPELELSVRPAGSAPEAIT